MKSANCAMIFIITLMITSCDREHQAQSNQTNDQKLSNENPKQSNAYPEQVFWGDTHLHTSNSVDAFGFGNRLDAEQALRFARGEEVTSTKGIQAKLSRPLDFLVISDHSDGLGATKALYEAPRLFVRDPTLRRWWDMMHESEEGSLKVTAELIDGAAKKTLPEALLDEGSQSKRINKLWRAHNKTVDRYNEAGKFSAFIGFEYTPMPRGNNLHRVVMFRDSAKQANKVMPLSSIQNPDPEQLWAWMKNYEDSTGGSILAMPHNSNVSNGLMFAMTRMDGSPIDKAYAETRARFEPVVEVTQIKGDSETHPFLSPNDEFADYGNNGWEQCNLSCTEDSDNESRAGSYVREALKIGLKLEQDTGVNPYAFGLIGSTDSHTSLATADENNFYGKHTGNEINVQNRALSAQNLGSRIGRFGWHYLSSGYAAAWARENTREAIFDAFKRREVYATTGPRVTVRMFAGHQFTHADLGDNMVASGYRNGVPMGGELHPKGDAAPQFLVRATMDPEGATLDRIQIIKGWINEDGNTKEKIYDIAWSNPQSRKPQSDGALPPVGNSVDLKTGQWDNAIGAPELETLWVDPNFNPRQSAFYYARILEIPTPTWPLYDAIKHNFELPKDVVKVSQERAYTSPIWYRPNTQ